MLAALLFPGGRADAAVARILEGRDEPDNRILECAVEGKAEMIVTGDKAMLAVRKYEGIRLITEAPFS